MWWHDIAALGQRLNSAPKDPRNEADFVEIDPGAVIDERQGRVRLGKGTRICAGAVLRGPIAIGPDCMIGNGAFLRGPLVLGSHVTVGFCTEIKNSIIADEVSIGPMCFVADSRIDRGAYLGAMVRTSNQRLDKREVKVVENGIPVGSGMDKLGCWIGEEASLGIQVIVLPGRVIAAGSLFEPRATVVRNLPKGHYRVVQTLERENGERVS